MATDNTSSQSPQKGGPSTADSERPEEKQEEKRTAALPTIKDAPEVTGIDAMSKGLP